MKKKLDVNAPLRNAYGDAYEEPKVEKGRALLKTGEWKSLNALLRDDDPVTEPVKLGKAIIMALDLASDKLDAKERVERFMLSTRVATAMKDGSGLEIDRDDEKRIDAASELITSNHMFIARIREALHNAKPVEPKKSKAA